MKLEKLKRNKKLSEPIPRWQYEAKLQLLDIVIRVHLFLKGTSHCRKWYSKIVNHVGSEDLEHLKEIYKQKLNPRDTSLKS